MIMNMSSQTKQTGASLMEMMVGLALSFIVTASMVALMSNSMGSATRITQMSKLTDDLRTAMNIMSRDVRRANYNANAIYCFANSDCADPDLDGTAPQAADIMIAADSEDCFVYGLDRNWDGNADNDGGGAFRRVIDGEGVGRVEMWIGDSTPTCAGGGANDWLSLTDPDLVSITEFRVLDSEDETGSYRQELIEQVDGEERILIQRVRFVQLELSGELILDNTISRNVRDTIKVRNDFLTHL